MTVFYTKSCLKSIGEKGWGMGDGGWGMGGKQSITGFLKLDRQLITGLKTDLVSAFIPSLKARDFC
jgi:hypothetical protein